MAQGSSIANQINPFGIQLPLDYWRVAGIKVDKEEEEEENEEMVVLAELK